MARQKKKQQPASRRLQEFEMRPVEKTDKWCQKKKPKIEIPSEAPFGYIITIPYIPNNDFMLSGIDGYIVRSKKHCGKLLLQVVFKEAFDTPEYGVTSNLRLVLKKGQRRKSMAKQRRILNIRNYSKCKNNDD